MYKAVLSIFLMVMPSLALAQFGGDPEVVYEMATENNIFAGVRAAGMGGAQIAAADDGSALWYNPALLTRIRRMELSGSLNYQRFFNRTDFGTVRSDDFQFNKTRFSSFWGVFPVPTEQGGLSLAVGAFRIKDFDRLFRYENQTGWLNNPTGDGFGEGEDDLGGLWSYSLGGGIEISRHMSLGLSFDILDGRDNYTYFSDSVANDILDSYDMNIKNDYSGYSGKAGLAYSAGPNFHIGATIKFPTYMKVKQEFTDSDHIWPELTQYKYTLPFSFGIGGLYAIKNLLLAADFVYTDYTELEYRSGVRPEDAAEVRHVYKDVANINLGAEYFVPQWGLTVRGGYSHDPIPFTYYPVGDQYHVFTAGFGYLLDRTLKFDMAVNIINWSRSDPYSFSQTTKEKYWAQRIFAGFTYRI